MLDRSRQICAGLAVALGGLHIVYGIAAYKAVTPDLIWFVGAGLAMICAGYGNFAKPAFIPSALLLVYFAVTAFILPLPQVFFGLCLFVWLTLVSISHWQKNYA